MLNHQTHIEWEMQALVVYGTVRTTRYGAHQRWYAKAASAPASIRCEWMMDWTTARRRRGRMFALRLFIDLLCDKVYVLC